MDELRYQLPPVVRGMTYDGSPGLFVTLREQEGSLAHLVLPYQKGKDISQQLKEVWQEAFSTYLTTHKAYPATVGFEGFSWSMGLGASLEDALLGTGTPYPREKSTQRGALMQGRISLVTGGAQGFGEGIVRSLVKEGGFVYIADLNKQGAENLAKALQDQYGKRVAHALEVDVTDEQSVSSMMHEVASLSGSLDLFISNAGVLKAGSVKELPLRDFQFVTSVDYTGFFICTKFASQQLFLQNMGSGGNYITDIITISSKSGLEGSNKNGAYAGAKFGTIGLTQSFALELVEDNIKVNAICPGNFLDGPLWSDPKRGLFIQYLNANKVPGAKTIEDVRKFYESKVPLRRGCRTEDVFCAICYVVEQTYETGQAIPVTGGQVMLN